MTTDAITFSSYIRKQDIRYKTFSKPNSLRRFRHAIEHSDWDEEILIQEEWIEKMCIGVHHRRISFYRFCLGNDVFELDPERCTMAARIFLIKNSALAGSFPVHFFHRINFARL